MIARKKGRIEERDWVKENICVVDRNEGWKRRENDAYRITRKKKTRWMIARKEGRLGEEYNA